MISSKEWFSSMITIRRGGRAVTAPRGWVAASKSLDSPEPEGADAQPASTAAATRMLAAAIRNLPTPAIGDPCSDSASFPAP